jgi:hypothetical protein
MPSQCECGMTLERPSQRTGCRECGTAACGSCAITVETTPYCRWCAPAHRQAA